MPEINIGTQVAAIVKESSSGSITVRVYPQWITSIAQRTEPYKNFPHKLKPALVKVADYVRLEMIPRTFTREGPGWRPLARRTRREREEQGYGAAHPILVRTKDLFKELTEKSHSNHVEIIKTGKYSRVIVGGSSEKFIRNQLGNDVYHIPSRPMIPGTGFLSLPDRDRIAIRNILETSVKQQLGKH